MESKQPSTYADFEIIKKIGQGSYGTVFRVKRKRDGQIYAMKVITISKMDAGNLNNTLVEIQILCSIDQKNIVGYKEAFLHNNNTELCIIMEYVGGGDLAEKINECKKRKLLINEDTIWSYFIQCLFGLRSLHKMKIIHRDIKSANIFMMEDFETIKLGDLNVAKVAKNDVAQTQIGTPYYLAPEIWKNQIYGYKCDVFSLGCVLYETAALRVPFEAGSLPQLYKKITQGIINKIPSVYSEDLYNIIKLCLKIDPKTRPSVQELLNHPLVVARMKMHINDLETEQNELNKLMATIKFEKKNHKININLPTKQKYRRNSADLMTENVKKIEKENPLSSNEVKKKEEIKKIPLKNPQIDYIEAEKLKQVQRYKMKEQVADKIGVIVNRKELIEKEIRGQPKRNNSADNRSRAEIIQRNK